MGAVNTAGDAQQTLHARKAMDTHQNFTASNEKETDANEFASLNAHKDLYKIVVDTRNLEITLFWQRSNYFLVLNSVLAVGFFNSKAPDGTYSFLLALFGFFVSTLWLRVTLGSKYWQSRWEQRLSIFEKDLAKNAKLFSADWDTMDKDVIESQALKHQHEKSTLKKWLEAQVLKKYSVSYNMMLLSMLFMAAWLLLTVISALRLFPW
jgi:hypothetical protein